MENAIIQRVILIKQNEKILSDKEFCSKISVSYDTYNTILKRNSTPKIDFILKINSAFEQYSLDWLLTGKGNMFIENNLQNNEKNDVFKDKYISELEENKQLRIQIIELKDELFEIKKQSVERDLDVQTVQLNSGMQKMASA